MKKRPQPKSELPREPFVTDVQTGLSLDAVKERISRGEVNGEQDVKTKSVGQILRENVLTFFNFVFVALAIILCCFSDWDNFFGAIGNFGFMGLVVFNTLLGTIQELRAKRTIDKLSLISAPKVKALRDGKECEIAVKDIVLDELVSDMRGRRGQRGRDRGQRKPHHGRAGRHTQAGGRQVALGQFRRFRQGEGSGRAHWA